MAITQRSNQINPATMATNWAQGVGSAGAKWQNGVRSPRRLPNADPSANVANWQTGVAAAGPKLQAALSDPSYLTNLDAGVGAKVSSYTGSGTTRKANAQAGFSKVAPMISSALSSLPPKGPKGTNTARSTAFQQAMHDQKGK